MKRVNILWLLLNSLFLIVFNLLFFMLGDAGAAKTSVWISYGFIHIAYFVLLATPYLIRRGSADYMYRRPPYMVTTTWFLVELVTGVTLILIAPETTKTTIIIQVILAAIFLAWLLILLIANEHTADSVERREAELQYVKESSAKLQSLLQQITDRPTAKKVERVYDLIYSSPSRSNANIHSLEQEIISEIEQLENVVGQNDTEQIISIADKIYQLADERNRLLKLGNK
jgi:mannitol-specific phosphotransferase system IIBC component